MPIVILFQTGLTLDTEEGRRSAFNFCASNSLFEQALPVADSTIDEFDREHMWGWYSGLQVGPPPEPSPIPTAIGFRKNVGVTINQQRG